MTIKEAHIFGVFEYLGCEAGRARARAILPTIAAILIHSAPSASAATITPLPNVLAGIAVSVSTVGGFGTDSANVPSSGFPLVVTVSSGGNVAIPNTSANAFAVANGGVNPTLIVEAMGVGGLGGSEVHAQADASAGLAYAFRVDGPATTSLIPVRFRGEVTDPLFINTGDGSGSAGGSVSLCCDTAGNPMVTVVQGSFNVVLNLTLSTIYTVLLQAQADIDAGLTPIDFPVVVDPTLTSDLTGYTIEYSPGLLSTSDTPLPAALPLFGSGLAALSLLGWRRKRSGNRAARTL